MTLSTTRMLKGLGLAAMVAGSAVAGGGTAALLTATSALAQSAGAIVVQGNRRVDAETIRSYFRLAPGERLDAVKVDEAYKALLATGLFEDVRISQAGGRIVVSVTEAPVINRVQFEGNRQVKDEQLTAEIQSKPRAGFSRLTARADVQRIIDIYRAVGRYDVRVEPKIIELPNNRVDLVYEIREGRKTAVREINFVGNRAYTAARLRDQIKTTESGILSFFKSNDVYEADRIEADKDLLRRWYLRNGYADVRIVASVAEFDPARNGFIVTFTIDEGDLYRYGVVDVQSNVPDLDPAILRSKIRPRPGAVYNAEDIEKTIEQTSLELAKGGYPFAQIRPRGDRNFEARTVDVVFVVDQGARAYIERINVRGNTRTRDNVIRREFDIAEGDAYNHALIDRAERRIKNLGYFKNAKISSEPGSAPDRVIVNVDVEEQPTGEFSVAGGYSSADGFLAEVSVAERNLLGQGQFAKAAVQYGQRTRGFDLSFVEPYLFGYRLAGGIDIFSKEILPSVYQSYRMRNTGGGLRLGIPITEEVGLSLRYSAYEQQLTVGPLNNCFPAAVDPKTGLAICQPASAAVRQLTNSGALLTSLVGYTLTYNTVNNPRAPTAGILAEFKQDFAGVGGDSQFIRTTGDARLYYNVGWDITALVRLQGGHITSYGGQQLSLLNHFFMGPNLVRGFQINGLGPRDLNSATLDAVGGTAYYGGTLELQYPLWFAPKDIGIKAAVFADAGTLFGYQGIKAYSQPGVDPRVGTQFLNVINNNGAIRSSVGAGLIWDSPFGPLRFDYAVALTKEKFDTIQQFRFSGGARF